MKIYFIDKTGRNYKIKDMLEKKGIQNIDIKDTYNFRCTKNDFVILSEYNDNDSENSYLSKYNNLIIITTNTKEDVVWKLANEFKTIDIISNKCNEEYVVERITKLIT